MTCNMIREQCEHIAEKYTIFARKMGENPLMTMPFLSSGAVGAVLACATKVVGCTTPFWTLFEGMFAVGIAVHSALISPLQSLPTKRTTYQSLIKSTLHVAWALRAGVINALLFDVFKHLSAGLAEQNRYFLCFWDVVSIVTILPVISNPLCNFTTGVLIVGGVAMVSLGSKYLGDKSHRTLSLEQAVPIENSPIPIAAGSESAEERESFFDSESRKFYFKPPSGKEINDLIEKYQVEGEYRGMSVGRRNRLKLHEQQMQPCDVYMLTKAPYQIDFERNEERRKQERKSLLSIFFERLETLRNFFALELLPLKSFRERMENLIKKQGELANRLALNIDSLLKTVWKNAYSSFHVCGEQDLLQMGYRKEIAQENHALILFYKPLPTDDRS